MTDVSIIICTRNRSYAITKCLDAISEAMLYAKAIDSEIVVVDNASEDDTAAVLKKWAEHKDVKLTIAYEKQKGLSHARNCGIKHASGDLLIFTDDDCIMAKEYIEVAWRYDQQDSEAVFRGGRVELGDPTDLPLSIKTDTEKMRISNKNPGNLSSSIANIFYGCNMAIKRSIIERVGLFDTRLGAGTTIPGGEDTDYNFRVYLAGIPLEYAPDMVVSHYHGRKLPETGYKLFCNYSKGMGALHAKYPFNMGITHQFYWDAKKMLKEIISGKNLFKPEIGFSYKHMFFNHIIGLVSYLKVMMSSGRSQPQ